MGCVLFELMTFQPPFKSESMRGLVRKIVRGNIPEIEGDNYSDELKTMVTFMLQVNIKLRPEASEILKMTLIKTLEKEILPDFFKTYSTKGKSKDTEIKKLIYMPQKNLERLSQHLPKSTYETNNKYEDFKEQELVPDIKFRPAYTTFPAQVRKNKVPDIDPKRSGMSYK